jgi:cytochrome c oxidase cbb3-type subunit III
MRVSANRRSFQVSRIGLALAASLLLLCAISCDPPGKPGPEEIAPENIVDFQTLYHQNCAACHGRDGKNGPGRIINDPLYLAILPRDTLRQVIQHGRPGTSMPAWDQREGGPLSAKQIDSLVNGIEKNWAKPVHFATALPSYTGEGITGDSGRGQKLFLMNCFACHGPGALVGTITSADYLSLVTDQMLRSSIIVGRPDLGMPDYRFLNRGHALSDQDIADLVAFLSSKRPAAITAMYESAQDRINGGQAGQQTGSTGQHVNESGSGQGGALTKGNEGSGTGPGSPRQQKNEGNKSTGSQSLGGPK